MAERRRANRYSLSWPVALDSGPGITGNISSLGMLIETVVEVPAGAEIDFVLGLPASPDSAGALNCRGRVIRTEKRNLGFGLAVELQQIRFEDSIQQFAGR